VKGINQPGRPVVGRPSNRNEARVALFPVGTDTAKESIYSRLRIEEPGPGYCHFNRNHDEEYFKQLTAEKVITKYVRGFPTRQWVKARPRNDALDCRVYAMGALGILNINLDRAVDRLQKDSTDEPAPVQKSNWVTGWRT
jgi:phage terminase large subunit GpA-like protein